MHSMLNFIKINSPWVGLKPTKRNKKWWKHMKIWRLEFCQATFSTVLTLDIHRNQNQKEFFNCYKYFLRAALTGYGQFSQSADFRKIDKVALFNTCMKFVIFSGQIIFFLKSYDSATDWLYPNKNWNQWIKVAKLDYFKKYSEHLNNYFWFRFLWIFKKAGTQNLEALIILC